MEKNFVCECGKGKYVAKYNTSMKNGEFVYKEGNSIITCECGKVMKAVEKKFTGVPAFGKFASASKEEKSKMLKERSKQHFKKHIADQRQEMATNDKIY